MADVEATGEGGGVSDGEWLAVTNWRKYQDYKVDDPYYVKLHVHILDDKKVQALPPLARLLWYQMLPLAARYRNALPYNVSGIAKETRLERHTVGKSLEKLLEVGLLRRTKTPRRIFEIVKKPPAELVESFLRNGGHHLTRESLLEEMTQRGVSAEDCERLLGLAQELAA